MINFRRSFGTAIIFAAIFESTFKWCSTWLWKDVLSTFGWYLFVPLREVHIPLRTWRQTTQSASFSVFSWQSTPNAMNTSHRFSKLLTNVFEVTTFYPVEIPLMVELMTSMAWLRVSRGFEYLKYARFSHWCSCCGDMVLSLRTFNFAVNDESKMFLFDMMCFRLYWWND